VRTLVVVPTHNEESNIVEILDRLRDVVPDADIMVVDDASTDGTRRLVKERIATDERLRIEERAAKRGLDADMSHDPEVLPTMLDVAERGIALVIGSRYVPGGTVIGWPRRRTWLSRWGNRYAAIVLGLAVNDATAGYRVYRTDTLRRIGIDGVQAGGYGFQVEMTYRVVRAGLGVVEIPIAFRDRVAGQSKMHRGIITEAFTLVTYWGLVDLVTLRRRHRAYREPR
jgi:dolichol-phosphate mannosyltransferase